MTFRSLSYWFAGLPFTTAVGALLINAGAPSFWDVHAVPKPVRSFLALHLAGIWFYAPFAGLLAFVAVRLNRGAHLRLTLCTPILFLAWVLVALLVFGLVGRYRAFDVRDLRDFARISVSILLIGYVYVGALMAVWGLVSRDRAQRRHAA